MESVIGIMGTLTSGNFFCPISPHDHPQKIREYLDDAEINLILTTRDTISGNLESELQSFQLVFIEEVTEDLAESTSVSVQVDPHQLAAVLYTSGSTGAPKGVTHTHHSLLHLIMNKGNLLGISASDRMAGLSTFTFGSYYWNVFAALLFGATLYLYDAYRFRFKEIKNWLIKRRISQFHCTPTVLRQILHTLQKPTHFPTLRLVTLGGETVYPRDIHRFQNLVANATLLGTTGATTESLHYSSVFFDRPFPQDIDQLPMGFPSPGVSVEVRDENEVIALPGQTGEITVSSDSLSPGYWKQPKLNAEKFKIGENQKRYFRLGDLGTFTSEGLLYHKGRMDFQVKIRGMRVDLGEVESVLYKHPDIKDAVVIKHAVTDGEVMLIAYIATSKNKMIGLDDLYNLLGKHLSPHQMPARIIFLDSLPLTRTYKIDRTSLPDPEKINRTRDPRSVAPRTSFEKRIHNIWGKVLGHTQFGVSDQFISVGGDSLHAMRVLNQIEAEFKICIPVSEFLKSGTVETLVDLVKRSDSRGKFVTGVKDIGK